MYGDMDYGYRDNSPRARQAKRMSQCMVTWTTATETTHPVLGKLKECYKVW